MLGTPNAPGLEIDIAIHAHGLPTDWPKAVTLTYLPVMHDMVAATARGHAAGRRNGPVGSPVVLAESDLPAGGRVMVKTPAFPEVDLLTLTAVAADDGAAQATFDGPRWAGLYELEYLSTAGDVRRVWHGRNVDPAEGDLVASSPQRLTAAAETAAVAYGRPGSAGGQAEAPPAGEYWRWLLAAALAVLAVEVFLGQRFGHYGTLRRSDVQSPPRPAEGLRGQEGP